MNITLNDYIANPMQNAGRVYTATMRETQRINYTNRFNNVLMREGGILETRMFYDEKKNTYYIHIKVPSEPIKKFYYDVVFKFSADASVKDLGRDLGKYNVQFFSNDPSFVFTYAHTFIKLDLFVKELTDFMSRKAIKDAAKITNPEDQVGYVKSLYFAYLYMKTRGLLNTNAWGNAENYSSSALSRYIMNADQKIAERIDEGAKVQAKNSKSKESTNVGNDKIVDPILGVVNTKTVKKVGTVKNTKTIGKVTRSRKNTK